MIINTTEIYDHCKKIRKFSMCNMYAFLLKINLDINISYWQMYNLSESNRSLQMKRLGASSNNFLKITKIQYPMTEYIAKIQ